MMTEGFLAVLFVWALADGDYFEASVIALRWGVLAWRKILLALKHWPSTQNIEVI